MKHTYLLILTLTMTIISCKNEEKMENLLLGRWEIKETKVNGETNYSLDNLYFDFLSKDSIRTNILTPNPTESDSYTIIEGNLTHQTVLKDFNYTVDSITDHLLILSGELRPQKNYQLVFSKAK